MSVRPEYDYCLIGGGLQSGLIALALAEKQPAASVLVVEKGSVLGGNHTWSFHHTDLPGSSERWFEAIPRYRWPHYRVQIKDFEREVAIAYLSIRSEEFAEHLWSQARRQDRKLEILTGVSAEPVSGRSAQLSTGELVKARCVIDCRGPCFGNLEKGTGYQTFFGWEVALERDWAENVPEVMNIDGNQELGFRFVYSLPFTKRRVLLQETHFANHSAIDDQGRSEVLRAYLSNKGHQQFRVMRQEHGCLPMPFARFRRSDLPWITGGYRGGWFHAATGYSLPLAARFAEAVSEVDASQAGDTIEKLWHFHRAQADWARTLNRMLFCLVAPSSRHQIFANFYKSLPESVISRFYAHTFSRFDLLRLMVGRPPRRLTPIRFISSYWV